MKLKKAIIGALVLAIIVVAGVFVAKSIFPLKYADAIDEYADEYNLSEELLMGVIYAESGFDASAHSGKVRGLMQITDETAKWIAGQLKLEYDVEMTKIPEVNIKMGSYYLSYLIDYYKDLETALAAYNAGMGNVSGWLKDNRYSSDGVTLKDIPFGETKRYVQRVKKLQTVYEILY